MKIFIHRRLVVFGKYIIILMLGIKGEFWGYSDSPGVKKEYCQLSCF
jgi:hypothetical protein